MKVGFEFGVISFISMIFISIIVSLISVMMNQNRAKVMAEYIVDCIEDHNGYNQDMIIEIEGIVNEIGYEFDVIDVGKRYHVSVRYPISICSLELYENGVVYSVSKTINS